MIVLPSPEPTERILERLQISIQQAMPDVDVDARVCRDRDYMAIVATLRASIYGENIRHISCKWPSTWWDAFKERWFPKWLLRRLPAEYTHRSLDAWAVYPTYKPIASAGEHAVFVEYK